MNKAKEVSTWILNWRWPCAFLRKAGSWGHWSVLWWTGQHCAWLGGMSIVWITAKHKELDSSEHSIISFENNCQSHGQQPLQRSWKNSTQWFHHFRQAVWLFSAKHYGSITFCISFLWHRSSILLLQEANPIYTALYVIPSYTMQLIASNWPNHWKKYKEKEDAEASQSTLRMQIHSNSKSFTFLKSTYCLKSLKSVSKQNHHNSFSNKNVKHF